MLVTVIIFLREVLEAALIVSILLAVSQLMRYTRNWIFPAMAFGFAGGGVMAYSMKAISNMLDGTGQEVINSTLLLFMIALITLTCIWLVPVHHGNTDTRPRRRPARVMTVILSAIVSLAVMDEISELYVYSYAAMLGPGNTVPLVTGGFIGTGIGASVGAILYYLLVNIPRKFPLKISIITLVLVAGGMASHLAAYLSQAGWLPSQPPVWNTSAIIPENSISGQLLYALIGYEATPSPIQVGFYSATVVIIMFSMYLVYRQRTRMIGSQ